MAGSYAPPKGVLFADPQNKPLINGAVQPLAYRYFYQVDGVTQATVYQDGYLLTPFVQPVVADASGRFPPIYLDPAVQYSAKLYNRSGTQTEYVGEANTEPLNIATSVLPAAIQTNSAVFAATGLSVTVPRSGQYAYELYLDLQVVSGTTPYVGFDMAFSGSLASGSTDLVTIIGSCNSNVPLSEPINTQVAIEMQTSGRTGVWARGSIDATTAGTLSFAWSNAATANIQLNAGSYLIVHSLTQGTVSLLFREPQNKPLSASGAVQPGAYWQFFYSGGSTPAPVYADAGLRRPLVQRAGRAQPSTTADINGRFSPIYLDPSIVYRTILYSVSGVALETVDPYLPRSFEPFTAVKLAPTTRTTGVGQSSDPALQLTLNPGVYEIEALLEYTSNGSGLTVTTGVVGLGGGGTIVSSGTADTLAFETNASGGAAGTVVIGSNLSISLVTAPSTRTAVLLHGSVTIANGTVILGVSWAPAGTAGSLVALTAGSYMTALQVG